LQHEDVCKCLSTSSTPATFGTVMGEFNSLAK